MRILLVAGCLMSLAGCGSGADPKPAASATMQSVKLPPATGSGNFQICLSTDVGADEVGEVIMPARIIFQSWGPMHGSLSGPSSNDPRALGVDRVAKEFTSYAVVTTEPFKVSPASRCIRVNARAAVSQGFRWSHQDVPETIHYSFQAEDLEVSEDWTIHAPSGEDQNPPPARQLLMSGALNGTPVQDIGAHVVLVDP